MKKGYVGYIRVAYKDESEVQSQKNVIDEYAKKNNIKIDCYYVDNGYSGTNLDRPQLIQMLREVRNKKITKGIIVKDMSRLGRGNVVIYKIFKQISKGNISLISTISKETSQNMIISSMIQWENDEQLERKKMGQSFVEQKVAVVQNPYSRGTSEDLNFRKLKTLKLDYEEIQHITFRYKDEIKKKVGNQNVRR